MLKLLAWSLVAALMTPGVFAAQRGAAKPPAAKPSAAAPAASTPVAPSRADASPEGEFSIAAQPAWVADAPASSGAQAVAARGMRRSELLDVQLNFMLPGQPAFVREHAVALDPATLAAVSQWQIAYNPAFQRVSLHSARVRRDGRFEDRLHSARIEPLRRETQLESQVIDGNKVLLVVLPDVRVGDLVEVSYSITGTNPLFGNRIAATIGLASDSPIDLLHIRATAPPGTQLYERSLGSDAKFERSATPSGQVLTLVRRSVAPVIAEAFVPPWRVVYPFVQISDYGSWSEVARWARDLFRAPPSASDLVTRKVEELRATGLQREALVEATLRFVQDEVRYFSVSIAENSHRPHPPETVLAQRLGDCKDKTLLLNTLLTSLGFDARPALVSLRRNRGIADQLPSHDAFDHAISQLRLDGKTYFLDATLRGQGLRLADQGYINYGKALLVDEGTDLVDAAPPDFAKNEFNFTQQWDFTDLQRPVKLTTTASASGLAAEALRSSIATQGLRSLSDVTAGLFSRVYPGLQPVGQTNLNDDRTGNVLTIQQSFEMKSPPPYSKGSLQLEVGAVELLEFLKIPQESQRQYAYSHDVPKVSTSRIDVLLPLPVSAPRTAAADTRDAHFRLDVRSESSDRRVRVTRRIERLADEVQPGDLARFRENVVKARGMLAGQMRVALVELPQVRDDIARIDRARRSAWSYKEDQLAQILFESEIDIAVDTRALTRLAAGTAVAGRVLSSRAIDSNLLGRFSDGLKDADQALAIDAANDEAIEARGVALVGLGQLDSARDAMQSLLPTPRRVDALGWLGSIALAQGKYAEAERHWRDVVAQGGGEGRVFALAGLFLAAEHQGGRGKEAVSDHLAGVDSDRLPGALVHYLAGRIDSDQLIKLAREPHSMERLNLAEAYFYIGQLHAARGKRQEALQWFDRTVGTKAVPQREVTFAELELKRPR